jgi:hypothetical protein
MMKFAQAAAKPDFVLLGAKFVQIMQRPFQLLDATALLMPVFTNSGIASATLAAVRHHAIGQMAVWIRAEGARGPRALPEATAIIAAGLSLLLWPERQSPAATRRCRNTPRGIGATNRGAGRAGSRNSPEDARRCIRRSRKRCRVGSSSVAERRGFFLSLVMAPSRAAERRWRSPYLLRRLSMHL